MSSNVQRSTPRSWLGLEARCPTLSSPSEAALLGLFLEATGRLDIGRRQ